MAVLRPVTGLAEDGSSWLARALAGGAGVLAPEEDPPAQFVHLDDLAARGRPGAAQAPGRHLQREPRRLDRRPAPAGPGRLEAPRATAGVGHRTGSATCAGGSSVAPSRPACCRTRRTRWLVANDRLKAEGWQPTVTNEQAFVAGTETRWWQLLTPKRRQELALGLAGVVSAVGVATAVLLIRRAVRAGRAARAGQPR